MMVDDVIKDGAHSRALSHPAAGKDADRREGKPPICFLAVVNDYRSLNLTKHVVAEVCCLLYCTHSQPFFHFFSSQGRTRSSIMIGFVCAAVVYVFIY